MTNKIISPFKPKNIANLKPQNFKIYTFNAGYKKYKDDLLVIVFDKLVVMSAVFTNSSTPAAPIIWNKKQYKKNDCKVLIVNSGNANAFTGIQGINSIKKYASVASKIFECDLDQVFVSSTGVIGEKLNPFPIIDKLRIIKHTKPKSLIHAAKAILTTDTYPKIAIETIKLERNNFKIYGIAKGSGMIAPNMGTMLSYIFIEAPLSKIELDKILKRHIDVSFNSISIDSDMSTSDTVMVFAINKDKALFKKTKSKILNSISVGLKKTMINLAKQIVCDGEGISKLIEVNVINASNKNQALKIAFSIAESPLVKTAIYGEDANWGRVIMAIGKTNERINQNKLILKFGDHIVAQKGMVANKFNEKKLNTYMKRKIISINLDLQLGKYNKTIWSSDLTKKYIEINSDYRS